MFCAPGAHHSAVLPSVSLKALFQKVKYAVKEAFILSAQIHGKGRSEERSLGTLGNSFFLPG